MEQPGFSEKLAALPTPHDLPSLQQALTLLAREIVSMMSQSGYLPLVRMIIAEAPRFPQLGALFFSTVTQRGFAIMTALLQEARKQKIIFFQAEDGIRDLTVTGVQTCALPI